MIAAVRGEVMVRRPDHVVIDAGGVGYRLTVSAETLKAVPATGREAFLHAELVSREDSLALFGFASEEERDLFGQLVSVSGVGPKVAIAVLSGGPARELLRAIRQVVGAVELAGMDVVEVAPPFDVSEITAAVAHRCVMEAISALAVRRRDGGGTPRPSGRSKDG